MGKDYAKASYILDKPPDAEKFVEMVPRVKLGTEKAAALIERSTTDRQVFQWMSIFTGWKENGHLPWHERMTLLGEPNGLMCVQARKYNALWLKGVNPQRALCPRCPKETLCNQVGYRSQTRKAAQSEYLITAQDGILFDKALQGFAKRIIGPKKRKKNRRNRRGKGTRTLYRVHPTKECPAVHRQSVVRNTRRAVCHRHD